jgi:hypothetical protein
LTGSGTNQFEFVGGWSYEATCGSCFQGDDHASGTRNAYYQFRFYGSQIKVYATKAPSFGKAAYSIDGGPETTVAHYSSVRQDQQLVFTSPSLTSGPHILKVRVMRSKSPGSRGYDVNIDSVVVTS